MLQVNHIIGFTEVKPADNLNPQRMAAADQILQKISFGRKIFIDMMKGDPACLLYTSDDADDLLCVDLGGRRIIKKKKYKQDNSKQRNNS